MLTRVKKLKRAYKAEAAIVELGRDPVELWEVQITKRGANDYHQVGDTVIWPARELGR